MENTAKGWIKEDLVGRHAKVIVLFEQPERSVMGVTAAACIAGCAPQTTPGGKSQVLGCLNDPRGGCATNPLLALF